MAFAGAVGLRNSRLRSGDGVAAARRWLAAPSAHARRLDRERARPAAHAHNNRAAPAGRTEAGMHAWQCACVHEYAGHVRSLYSYGLRSYGLVSTSMRNMRARYIVMAVVMALCPRVCGTCALVI